MQWAEASITMAMASSSHDTVKYLIRIAIFETQNMWKTHQTYHLQSYHKPTPVLFQPNTLHTPTSSFNRYSLTDTLRKLSIFDINKNASCQTCVLKHQAMFLFNCIYIWHHCNPCKPQASQVKSINNIRLIYGRCDVTCLKSYDTSFRISEVSANSVGVVF